MTAKDLAMFEQFRIPLDLVERAGIKRVTDSEARNEFGIVMSSSADCSGVIFPYFDPTSGNRVSARLRRDNPEIKDGKAHNKYVSAYGDRRHLYFPPDSADLIADVDVPIVLMESEKAVLAVTAWSARVERKLLAAGCGGCWGWHARIGKAESANGNRVDEVGPLPDLKRIALAKRPVFVLFDANAATNPQVRTARAALIKFLQKQHTEARVINLPAIANANGPDDYLAIRADDDMTRLFDRAHDAEFYGRELITMALSEVKARKQSYLYKPYLPNDQLIADYGPSHVGKSIVALDWGARTTTGAAWPDGSPNTLGPRKVLMLSAGEDAVDTVLKPRFLLAGGDASRLIIIKAVRPADRILPIKEEMFALDRDIDLLADHIDRDREIALVIIDPISAHVGSRKLHLEEEIRPLLTRLKDMAEQFSTPILQTGHLNRRDRGTVALDRMLGARAFSGVPRTIYLTGPDNDTAEPHRYVMAQERGLGAPAWKYHTELAGAVVDGADVEQIRIVWDGTDAEITGQDAVDPVSRNDKSIDADAAADLVSFIQRKGGKSAKEDCVAYLSKIYGPSLNMTRVRRRANVESCRDGKYATWSVVVAVPDPKPPVADPVADQVSFDETQEQEDWVERVHGKSRK